MRRSAQRRAEKCSERYYEVGKVLLGAVLLEVRDVLRDVGRSDRRITRNFACQLSAGDVLVNVLGDVFVLILHVGLSSPACHFHVCGCDMLHRAPADRLITQSRTNRSLATIN